MNQFQDTPITDLETGRTFLHRSYCGSPKEAADYARMTFTNPKLFAIGLAGQTPEPVVEAAQAYSEGWNQNNPEKKPGWTIQNLDPTLQTATETKATVQTELF